MKDLEKRVKVLEDKVLRLSLFIDNFQKQKVFKKDVIFKNPVYDKNGNKVIN